MRARVEVASQWVKRFGQHAYVLALESQELLVAAASCWRFERDHPEADYDPLLKRLKNVLGRRSARPPASTEQTRALWESIRIGDRVQLSNGYLLRVLELPHVAGGWELVRTEPTRPPRPGTDDPTYLLVPLTQITERVAAAEVG